MRNEYFNNNKALFDLHLLLCGNEKYGPTFSVPTHMRDYHLIHYIANGNLVFVENGISHDVSAGDIFVIYPDTLVSYYTSGSNEDVSCCWVGITGSNVQTYLECAGVTPKNPVIHMDNTDFPSSVNHMVECFEKALDLSELMLNRQLLRCIRSIEKSIKKEVKRYNNSIEYTEDAINFIAKNFMTGITANDVVNYLKLNRSYLYKIFKKHTGQSISQYLVNFRIERAKEFIRNYNFTFSQISEFVGITNIYYFSKLFKQVTGETPSEYKRHVSDNKEE